MLAGSCAAFLVVGQGAGVLAGEPAVTMVSPPTSTALAPIPGVGASWFAPEDIEVMVHQARNDHIDAEAAVTFAPIHPGPRYRPVRAVGEL